jgi:hypothetical protein
MKLLITWTPRIIAMLLIALFLIFSLDAFEMGGSLLEKIAGYVIHATPGLLILVALVMSFRRPLIGGSLFTILGIITLFFFNVRENPIVLLIVTGPLLLTGLLFLWSSKISQKPTP